MASSAHLCHYLLEEVWAKTLGEKCRDSRELVIEFSRLQVKQLGQS